MLIYNVTIQLEKARAEEWLAWMRSEHIPDVMRTGMFSGHRLSRLLDQDAQSVQTFVIQYFCDTHADYRRYQDEFAPALQKAHREKFARDFVAVRTLMEVL